MKQKTVQAYAYFPVEWRFGDESKQSDGMGGPPVDDPTMIYFVEGCDDNNEGRVWKFTLGELIDDVVDGGCSEDGIIGDDHIAPLCLLRDGLRKAAAELDAQIRQKKRREL